MHNGQSGAEALKGRSMTSAPVPIAGRNSCRYTTSVVALRLCPTRRAISSTGTPSSDISDTNVCLVFANPVFGGIRVAIGLP